MLIIPELIWETMLEQFQVHLKSVEQVAYLDGLDVEACGCVTTLTFPDASLEKYNYRVSADAMSEAGKHLRKLQLVRLAQVHTHPGSSVAHSPEDDRRAYSQEHGAVSIVIPNYGRNRGAICEIGFHVREARGWRRVESPEFSTLVSFIPSILDFRRR